MPLCNNQVVQHGFSSFLVIHRKRECAVFSGERNASARCLPAYNSCSSSRVTSTRRPGLFARGTASDWLRELVAPPTTSVYWTELGRKKPRPLGFPPPCMPLPRETSSKHKEREGCLVYCTHEKHSAGIHPVCFFSERDFAKLMFEWLTDCNSKL